MSVVAVSHPLVRHKIDLRGDGGRTPRSHITGGLQHSVGAGALAIGTHGDCLHRDGLVARQDPPGRGTQQRQPHQADEQTPDPFRRPAAVLVFAVRYVNS